MVVDSAEVASAFNAAITDVSRFNDLVMLNAVCLLRMHHAYLYIQVFEVAEHPLVLQLGLLCKRASASCCGMCARKREQESIVVVLASILALFGVMCQGKQCVDSRLSVAFRN